MRRSLASVLTIMSLCALSACTSPPEPTMTLDESKQQLVEILTAGADAAGGEWDDKFDRATEPCVDRYGREGQRYALNSFGPGTGEARRVVERVKAVWEEMGFEVFVRERDFGVIEVVYPHDEDGLAFGFGANENASILDGVSACVPGE